jgi:allantoinase
MPATAIISNRVITPTGMKRAVVLLKNGIITAVENELPAGEFNVIDVADKILMAGIIDPHVHINEPGRGNWEGFDTGTRSALAGGITTLVDMPLNSSPVTTNAAAFDQKISATTGKLHADCGFWGGVVPGNLHEIPALIDKGVLGFKAFLTPSGIDEFPNVTEADLRKVMPLIAKHELPLLVHCELSNDDLLLDNDPRVYKNYLHSRPEKWEEDAIAMMIRLSGEYECRVHVVHLSAASSIAQLEEAKRQGIAVTVETAPHYLFFHAEEIGDSQTQFKCAPPIREKKNNEALWSALNNGIIDFVATDHSPSPPAMKQTVSGNFMKAWGGIAGLQFSLPVLWTAARERNIAVTKMAEWLCSKPAALPGLQNFKGSISEGFQADLVVWDPENSFKVMQDLIQHRHKLTPYLDRELWGVVEMVFLKGIKVFDRGEFNLNNGSLLLA